MYSLQEFIRTLEGWGLTDVMLPFLLIFILFFAVLEKTKVLGEGKKNLNVAVSLIIGLLVVIPHVMGLYPPNRDVVDIMNRALPSFSIVVVAIMMLLLLLGIFGGDAKLVGMKMGNWIAVISLIIILWIFGGAAGWGYNNSWLYRVFGSDTIAIILILLVFGIIIAFVTGGESKEKGYVARLGDDLKGIFGGGGK